MNQPQPHYDITEIRAKAHELGKKRREARAAYERFSREAADADRDYRKRKAVAFTRARAAGASVAEAELDCDAAAADDKHRRDIAQSLAKAQLLRIEELEADRAMLRQLGEWSQRMEHVA